MSDSTTTYQSSHRSTYDQNSLRKLMRDHGERYIKAYTPYKERIKLIRAMRMCKSPGLGGRVIVCKQCKDRHYIYYSCGHSHCPICQSIKREQWVDKLRSELYKVPYVHTTFTLPHDLNGIARSNSKLIFGLLMRTAWQTVKQLTKDEANIGALPGMISVLHTFGSDMKYHIHVHCLITFGGLTSNGDWVYPNRKYKIARYRELSAVYKSLFLKGLRKMYDKGEIDYHITYEELTVAVKKKRWVVHNTRPTIDTKVLEEYLARYINRVAITNSRLQYVKAENEVRIIYNDYKSQIAGKAAPKKVRSLDPLVAIDQIMQHVLPPYFQKSRRYGLHSPITKKRLSPIMPEKIKRNGQTIRTLIEILTQLLKQKPYQCSKCGSTEYEIEEITGDRNWIHQYIALSNCRSPPMMPNISNGCR